MSTVRVQYRRRLDGAPSGYTSDVYIGANFDAPSGVPAAGVVTTMQRMWDGLNSSGLNAWQSCDQFDQTAGAAEMTFWEWSPLWVQYHTEPRTVASGFAITGPIFLPHQCGVTFGYRSTSGPNPRLGRSRWQYGPIAPGSTFYTSGASGGGRLSAAGVTRVMDNVQLCLATLAGLGWTLQVMTNRRTIPLFAPALECYVSDVITINRKRRTWPLGQEREAI